MADYDSDDLEDFDESMNEEFNEDDLDDEEYDQLYASLPKLKQSLASYNDSVPEFDLKEALYYHHYEIEPAVKDIKTRFKKKGMYFHPFFQLWILYLNFIESKC